MHPHIGKIFAGVAALLLFVTCPAFSRGHHNLNGTWKLIPARGELEGQAAVQTGTVTINDREHNIYISRNYTYNSANETVTYNFSTDGAENSTVRDGKTLKSKAKWEGDTLVVTTMKDNESAVERYSSEPDGTLKLFIERPAHASITLYFQRVGDAPLN
jgi:hypothetical protein